MKLKFKIQQYQSDAVNSIVNCFLGQETGSRVDVMARYLETVEKDTLFESTNSVEVFSFGNKAITLLPNEIRKNIRSVQRENDINFTDDQNYCDFSIEMETGTGKTYTYIKSMYELNKEYGWSKFIVMVPSIAIREGVQKSFQITEDHFQEQYNKKIRYFVYNSTNSSNIANINNFASDDSIQVMIINYQAFNAKSSANRRIYEELDELQSRRPIDVISSVKPILIIDEPQKFGDKTEEFFSEFKPLFTVRYSATHKKGKEYNKIYRLDALDAYNQKLVKKINVKGVEILNNKSNETFLFLDSVNISQKHDPIAIMEIEVKSSTGTKRKLIRAKSGDDLYIKSGELTAYKGYTVSEIDARYEVDKVSFTNGVEISVGQVFGDVDQEHIVRIQIRETIRSHFEKERQLNNIGVKALSLFFIDEVAKYKYYDDNLALKGDYARIFEEEYEKAIIDFRTLLDSSYLEYLDSFETGKVHAGYFSIDKKGREIDSAIKDKKEYLSFDEDAYDLIMKDKERLLSLDEPVRFIFSHSALREGWDNPNVFQICTLKHSNSAVSKRQEIGRGLRICVNNNGDRMDYGYLENDFHNINTLTVIASESYDSFAKSLQSEIKDSLTNRPSGFEDTIFLNKVLVNEMGEKFTFTKDNYQVILVHSAYYNYVDINNKAKITDKLKEDLENNQVQVPAILENFSDEYCNLLKKMFLNNSDKLINNERKNNIKTLNPNNNFMKKEFQDLWNKINVKTVYQVSFNSDELITNVVERINLSLEINKMKVRVTTGEQRESITTSHLNASEALKETGSKTELIDVSSFSTIKYDLIGEVAKVTGLTRKTIVKILSSISESKFALYKNNPEEFIRKVSKIIEQEKATAVIDGITYHKIDQTFTNDIFTINCIQAGLGNNAVDVQKHIYDYLVTDSKNEQEFAKKLETGEVTVYAKLPNGFKIPTPVGNYNPDWAIVFDNKDFKYIYFIAETKGSLNSMELREVEKAKIECAKKHFLSICNDGVKYDVVDNYQSLIEILTSN